MPDILIFDINSCDLPTPIIGPLKKYNDIKPDRYEQKLEVLIEISEITIKVFATITAKYCIVHGAKSHNFKKCLADFKRPAVGHWLTLLEHSVSLLSGEENLSPLPRSIVEWYRLRAGDDAELLRALQSLPVALPGAKLPKTISVSSVLGLLSHIRNRKSHGAQVTPEEIKDRCILLHKIIDRILVRYRCESSYSYCYLEEVKYGDRGFNIDARLFYASESYLSLVSNLPLSDGRFYAVNLPASRIIEEAVDLSPFIIVRTCRVCKSKQILVYNGRERNTVEFLSYTCGHQNEVNDALADFEDIASFFEGELSLSHMLEGKVIGPEITANGIRSRLESNDEYLRLLAKGKGLIEDENYEAAFDVLLRVGQLNDNCPEAQHLCGLVGLMLGRKPDEVIERLEYSCRISPDSYLYHLNCGRVLRYYQFEAKALTFLDKALELNPSSETARAEIAELGDIVTDSASENFPADEQKANELAIALLESLKQKSLGLKMWLSALFPWTLVCKKPFAYSLGLALCLFLGVSAINFQQITQDPMLSARLGVISSLIFLGLFVPVATPSLLESMFARLKSVVTLPEDAYYKWFSRETESLLGSATYMKEGEKYTFKELLKYDRRYLVWFAITFFIFAPFQYECAMGLDPFALGIPNLARYALYFIELYALSWVAVYCVDALLLIPRFVSLPIRFFPGMPDNVSLKPLGSFFVLIASLASITSMLITVQHALFDTYEKVKFFSVTFVMLTYTLNFLILFVSQIMIYFTLSRLRERKMLEFSYHIENEFRHLMKNPKNESFEKLVELKANISKIEKMMSANGLSAGSMVLFLVTAALQTACIFFYLYFPHRH